MTTPEGSGLGQREPRPDDYSAEAGPVTPADSAYDSDAAVAGEPGTPSRQETSRREADEGQLVPQEAVMDFRARWEAIQQGFVDDPRSAVGDADRLVGEVLERLSGMFEDQHRSLERQWSEGEPDTEDLRSALQRYRAFFNRLLAI